MRLHAAVTSHNKMTKTSFILPVFIFLTSCLTQVDSCKDDNRHIFLNDSTICDSKGIPRIELQDEPLFVLNIDTINKGKNNLYALLNEPILYNNYLGKETYRFQWSRSFNEPTLIIRIEKCDDNIKLFVHEIYFGIRVKLDSTLNIDTNKLEKIFVKFETQENETDSMFFYVKYYEKDLNTEQWDIFISNLNKIDFYNLPSKNTVIGFDGSNWCIEGHKKCGYYIVDRWCDQELENCGRYLISLTGNNYDPIY
jgi:hypothetical protein